MQQLINIQLGDWLPDQSAMSLPGHLKEACNVLPTKDGYAPMPGFENLGGPTLPQSCEGFITLRDTVQQPHVLAGCPDGVYTYKKMQWQNLFPVPITTPGHWHFAHWGKGVLLNHPGTGLLFYDLIKQEISHLSNAPVAQTMGIVRDYVFLGGFLDNPYRLAWSALNNPADFDPNLATHADYQDIPNDKGKIQKIVDDLVFTDKTLYQLRYVGVPYIWQLVEIPESHGTMTPGSVVRHQDGTFYLAESGFYCFDGKKIQAIGHQRVNKTFCQKLDHTQQQSISATIDPLQKLVFWSYPTNNKTRELLIYNWETGQWSWSDQPITALGYFDQYVVGVWQNQFVGLKGDPCPATLETWDRCFFPTKRSWITGINITSKQHPTRIGIKTDVQTDYTDYQPQKWQLFYPLRSNGYHHSLRLRFAGTFAPQKSVSLKVKAIGRY